MSELVLTKESKLFKNLLYIPFVFFTGCATGIVSQKSAQSVAGSKQSHWLTSNFEPARDVAEAGNKYIDDCKEITLNFSSNAFEVNSKFLSKFSANLECIRFRNGEKKSGEIVFKSKAFKRFKNLDRLNVVVYGATLKIETGAFSQSTIKQFNSRRVNIAEIQQGAFAGAKNLKTIAIVNSYISNIQPGAFDGLQNLKALALYDINESLPVDSFKDLKGLVHLELSQVKVVAGGSKDPQRLFPQGLLSPLGSLKLVIFSDSLGHYPGTPEDIRKHLDPAPSGEFRFGSADQREHNDIFHSI